MFEKLSESEIVQFISKVIFPALIGVSIRLAVEMKKDKTKISLSNVCLSMITGVGTVYVLSGYIQNNFNEDIRPIIYAFLAIVGDKIAEYLIYRFSIDAFLTAIINSLFTWISSGFNQKK